MYVTRVILVGLAIAVSCAHAAAQSRLIISGQGSAAGSPSATISVNLARLAVEWSIPSPWVNSVVTANGRYLVAWPVLSPASELWIYDFSTGAITAAPLGGHVLATAVAHTRRLEVFAAMTDGVVARISTSGLAPLLSCEKVTDLDLSADNRRLVLACGSEIVVADADSGVEVARFSIPAMFDQVGSLIASFDGARVVALLRKGGLSRLALFDVATGRVLVDGLTSELSWTVVDEHVTRLLAPTPGRDAVLLSTTFHFIPGWYGHRSLLVDFGTLTIRQSLPLVGVGTCKVGVISGCLEPFDAVFTADGRYVIAGSRDTVSLPLQTAPGATVQIVDLSSNTLVASTGADFFASGGLALALASAPLPPGDVSAAIRNGAVTVSWALPPESAAATAYRFEAGSGPGLLDLVTRLTNGDQTVIVFADVPPGRYFVRVRAINAMGMSDPSRELVVDVSER